MAVRRRTATANIDADGGDFVSRARAGLGSESSCPCQEKSRLRKQSAFFQLNPPLAEEIHLWWMKSLRDEIPLRGEMGGGFDFI